MWFFSLKQNNLFKIKTQNHLLHQAFLHASKTRKSLFEDMFTKSDEFLAEILSCESSLWESTSIKNGLTGWGICGLLTSTRNGFTGWGFWGPSATPKMIVIGTDLKFNRDFLLLFGNCNKIEVWVKKSQIILTFYEKHSYLNTFLIFKISIRLFLLVLLISGIPQIRKLWKSRLFSVVGMPQH